MQYCNMPEKIKPSKQYYLKFQQCKTSKTLVLHGNINSVKWYSKFDLICKINTLFRKLNNLNFDKILAQVIQ